ncbi:hypothetical protein IHE44_0008492 [Lamprotornis superbus]|uniref:Protein kinase domain-containing protein n=1 Tax=Lamprotornis superbus TaxID=245042 RepID=A0A835NNY4_9PASS|nr:hypothetical protein IHE44_0008492 [Lamprotornis superbus]
MAARSGAAPEASFTSRVGHGAPAAALHMSDITSCFLSLFSPFSQKSGELVAVKVFNNASYLRPQEVQMREFEMLRKLNHKNIVKLFAVEETVSENPPGKAWGSPAKGGDPVLPGWGDTGLAEPSWHVPLQGSSKQKVLVMEYCSSGSLLSVLEDPANAFGLAESEFLIVLQCVGMNHLRENGVVHRDIKPGNIMRLVGEDGRSIYKLTDFGAARELEDDEKFVSVYGTEEYLHPDVYERAVLRKPQQKVFGVTVDLWSIGVTFYHAATGSLPFVPFGGPRRNKEIITSTLCPFPHPRDAVPKQSSQQFPSHRYKITTEKPPGAIAGIQRQENGNIEWSYELPITCRLSAGLKDQLIPILANILEVDQDKCWGFDQFFAGTNDILHRIVVDVFSLQQASSHRIYIHSYNTTTKFLDAVFKQTNIVPHHQEYFFEGHLYELDPNLQAHNFCKTTESSPLTLLSTSEQPEDVVGVRYRDPALEFPKFVPRVDVVADCSAAKSALGAAHQTLRVGQSLRRGRELLARGLHWVIGNLRTECSRILEQRRGAHSVLACLQLTEGKTHVLTQGWSAKSSNAAAGCSGSCSPSSTASGIFLLTEPRSCASCRGTGSIRAGLKPAGVKTTILEQIGHNRASFYQISTLHLVAQMWSSEIRGNHFAGPQRSWIPLPQYEAAPAGSRGSAGLDVVKTRLQRVDEELSQCSHSIFDFQGALDGILAELVKDRQQVHEDKSIQQIECCLEKMQNIYKQFKKARTCLRLSYNEEQIHKLDKLNLGTLARRVLSIFQNECVQQYQEALALHSSRMRKVCEIKKHLKRLSNRISSCSVEMMECQDCLQGFVLGVTLWVPLVFGPTEPLALPGLQRGHCQDSPPPQALDGLLQTQKWNLAPAPPVPPPVPLSQARQEMALRMQELLQQMRSVACDLQFNNSIIERLRDMVKVQLLKQKPLPTTGNSQRLEQQSRRISVSWELSVSSYLCAPALCTFTPISSQCPGPLEEYTGRRQIQLLISPDSPSPALPSLQLLPPPFSPKTHRNPARILNKWNKWE